MMKYIFFDILFTELWVDKAIALLGLDLDDIDNDVLVTT